MNKQKIAALSALTLIVLGGSAVGLNATRSAYAQTPTVQVQKTGTSVTPEKETANEVKETPGTEAPEVAGKEAKGIETDGPGGHQDQNGTNADHQFEGTE